MDEVVFLTNSICVKRRAEVIKQRLMFTLPTALIIEPVIYHLGQQFNIVINIRQANLSEGGGWIELDLEGEIKEIEAGVSWATSKGVRVEQLAEI